MNPTSNEGPPRWRTLRLPARAIECPPCRGFPMSSSAGVQVQPRARQMPTHWRIADIDFDSIDRAAIVADPFAFRIVFLASFIETGSDLYAGNLVEYFADDAEVSRWLRETWQRQEVQHGNALRT